MARGQDNSDADGIEYDDDDDIGSDGEWPGLSDRAIAIKRQIAAGTYQVNLTALAESLLGEVKDAIKPLPQPKNDQDSEDS